MSDTITHAEESVYPSLSEATENDVRESSVEIEEGSSATPDIAAQTAEERPAAPDAEPESEPEDLAARNARLARELREQRRLQRQLQEQNAVLQGQRKEPPDEAMQREINQRAVQLAQAQVINQKSNDIYAQGIREFGKQEFDDSVRALNDAFGQQIMPVVLDTIVDMPDAQKLIQHLADNPDVADKLAMLPPHKLGAALEREANKMAQKVKPLTKAPTPVQPIRVQATVEPEIDLERMSMEQLDKLWTKRDFLKRMEG